MRSFEKKTFDSARTAEETAAEVLAWLAGDPELLGRFFALTGVGANDIRSATNDSGFLIGVLDFVMSHEPTLMAFSNDTGVKPERVVAAARTLNGPGAAEFGW